MEHVRIFVSHSSADNDFGLQLIQDLRSRFYTPGAVWYDRSGGIWAGDEWWNQIVDEITSRDVFVVILSPDAMASKWVQAEIAIAWNQRIAHGKRILPVLYRPASIRADLATLDIISFEKAAIRDAYNTALEELVAAIMADKNGGPTSSSQQIAQASLRALALTCPVPVVSTHSNQDSRILSVPFASDVTELEGIEMTTGDLTNFQELKRLLTDSAFEIVHFFNPLVTSDFALQANGDTRRSLHEAASRLLRLRFLPDSTRLVIVQGFGDDFPVDQFIASAPYILVIKTEMPESGEHVFIREFYTAYALSHSVERALEDARFLTEVMPLASPVSAELKSRARRSGTGSQVAVHVGNYPDPLTVDLGAVEEALDSMGMPREALFETMARKLEVHAWIFARPRENAILPIGSTVIGVFSWDNAATIIRCLKLFRIDERVDPLQWTAWCRLLIAYNDLCGEEYRTLKRPADPGARHTLQRTMHRSKRIYDLMQPHIDTLAERGFPAATLSYSLAKAFLDQAETKLLEDDLPMTVSFLESALTSVHDIITTCMPQAIT